LLEAAEPLVGGGRLAMEIPTCGEGAPPLNRVEGT
jgi:hypothetical protein